jgi:PBSX family phage terminase large subunit
MEQEIIEISDKQAEYIREANHRWNGKIGATQCGKTYIDTLFVIPNRIIERAGKKGLNFIVGVSKETIQRNIIEPLQEIYGNKAVTDISSKNTATIMGERVYCLGADNVGRVSKFRGARAKYIYIDEIVDINQEVFELLKSRLSFSYSLCDFAGNPQSLTHWAKKFIESDIDIYVQHYTIFDNPFLPQEYVKQLCKEYEGTVYYHRYILGQWCNAEGIIFQAIANDRKRYETDNIDNGYISIGIDWGGNKSYHSITATTIKRDYSKIQVLKSDRLKATGTGTKELFRWIIGFIREIQNKYGTINSIFCDSAEQVLKNSLYSELINDGIHISVNDSIKTPIKDRIECITRLLNLDNISFVKGQTNTIIEALQTALYDDKAKDDRWIDDGETSDIDSLDSFVYSWEYWMQQLARR